MEQIVSKRLRFTIAWNILNSNVKSLIISAGAIVLATGALSLSKVVFPDYDFSQLDLVVITAIGGFVTNLIKDYMKLG